MYQKYFIIRTSDIQEKVANTKMYFSSVILKLGLFVNFVSDLSAIENVSQSSRVKRRNEKRKINFISHINCR